METGKYSTAVAAFSAKFSRLFARFNIMDSKKLSTAIAEFSAKFCNELEKGKSVVSSPLSAEFVLALLALGTTEPAHSQLLTALGITSDDDIRSSFAHLSSHLKDIKGVTLNVANKVYIKEGNYKLQPELESDAVRVFNASLEQVNFSNGETAAKLINSWVESKTNDKIKDIVSPDSFSDDTRIVLVNAIYFKGFWKNQFDSGSTEPRPFHVTKTRDVNVPMMCREGHYRTGRIVELDARVLEIPYKGDEASMLIVLPNDIEGLSRVLKKLADGFNLLEKVDKSLMQSTEVELMIPKFKIETEIDLKVLLRKLGVKSIFDKKNSCLTKIIDNNESLYISKAVQKAIIEVNEEGTEAAAATGFELVLYCATPKFHADRPFLYVLTSSNRTILFIGTYTGDI